MDDDRAVLRAVARLLRAGGFSNVITYHSPAQFLKQSNPSLHGCVVLDMMMPELGGFELKDALTAKGVHLPIIFLTGHGDISMAMRAWKGGAVDFLIKPVRASELIPAVRAAVERDREQRMTAAQLHLNRARVAKLTRRELEVLRHVVAGQLNKRIAAQLGVTEKTIKAFRGRIMEKLEVESLAELVRLALHVGVLAAR